MNDPHFLQHRKGCSVKLIIWLLLILLAAAGVVIFGLYLLIRSDTEHIEGGDPQEDRRALLRHVDERLLRSVSQKLHFRGTLVVEAVEDGQHDLWLIETSRYGTKTTRLTHSPANETSPVWSPDGKWIAYFSDATGPGGSRGKPEVFVYHLEDGKSFPITNAPEIDWHGPLDWDYGSSSWTTRIELTGTRRSAPAGDLSGSGFFHLPVSGVNQDPVLLEKTQGAVGLSKLYGSGPFYGTSDGILVYNTLHSRMYPDYTTLSNGRYEYHSRSDDLGPLAITGAQHARGLDLVPGAFGTTGTDIEVIYMLQGEPPDGEVGFEIGVARIVNQKIDDYKDADGSYHYHYELDHIENHPGLSGRIGTIQNIIPIAQRKFLALQDGQLDGSHQTGCLRLHFYDLYEIPVDQGRPPLFPDLCLDALPDGFHPQSAVIEPNIRNDFWATWRIFSARDAGESTSSLYAVLMLYNQAYLHIAQLRKIPAQINGEIVPGSVRIVPYHWNDSRDFQEASRGINPQPAP